MSIENIPLRYCSKLLVVAMVFVAGCGRPTGSSGEKVATSIDGQFQVTMPSDWAERSDLNDTADIQVGNFRENFLVVISESKEGLENPTIEWLSKMVRSDMLKNLNGGRITAEPKKLQINGWPAVQYKVRGIRNEVKIIYLLTIVDSGQYLHRIVAWSTSSKYASSLAVLESVTNSFKATSR